jgi:hypothetical protein
MPGEKRDKQQPQRDGGQNQDQERRRNQEKRDEQRPERDDEMDDRE